MKYEDRAKLHMKRSILMGGEIDLKTYSCSVLWYDSKDENIYLLLENDVLQNISLDCVYECELEAEQGILTCTGTVKERFYNEHGKVLKFQIQNGFYKISVKSVDKQKA